MWMRLLLGSLLSIGLLSWPSPLDSGYGPASGRTVISGGEDANYMAVFGGPEWLPDVVRTDSVRPTGLPTFRGGTRPEVLPDTVAVLGSRDGQDVDCPAEIYSAINRFATEYDLPASIMVRLAHAENPTFDPRARYTTNREDSVGLYQNNRRGGLGSAYTVVELEDVDMNIHIAFSYIRGELDRGKSIYEALWPWENARKRIFDIDK